MVTSLMEMITGCKNTYYFKDNSKQLSWMAQKMPINHPLHWIYSHWTQVENDCQPPILGPPKPSMWKFHGDIYKLVCSTETCF